MRDIDRIRKHTVPEFTDPVFAKTSPKRSFSIIENERFGLVFAKTGSMNSGTGLRNIVQGVLLGHSIKKISYTLYILFPPKGNSQMDSSVQDFPAAYILFQ